MIDWLTDWHYVLARINASSKFLLRKKNLQQKGDITLRSSEAKLCQRYRICSRLSSPSLHTSTRDVGAIVLMNTFSPDIRCCTIKLDFCCLKVCLSIEYWSITVIWQEGPNGTEKMKIKTVQFTQLILFTVSKMLTICLFEKMKTHKQVQHTKLQNY